MPPSLHHRRRRERRVLLWCVGAAALLHAAVFVYWSGLRAEPPASGESGMSLDFDSAAASYGIHLDLFFGPPTLYEADGGAVREPETRFLEAGRVVQLFGACPILFDPDRMPVRGRVRLTLDASGAVASTRLVAGTPERCTDELLERVASALLYEWLPSERHPAPLDLVQPVMIREARR